jgi:protein-L-isoaspartate(D-aspartate) O-methyltransferase
MVGDGYKGWPKQAPFDRIIVTAAAREVPPPLADQLGMGGTMVIPLESAPMMQELVRITRDEQGFAQERLLPVRFVPLVEGVARES